jgi:hypothetical protein
MFSASSSARLWPSHWVVSVKARMGASKAVISSSFGADFVALDLMARTKLA